MLNRLRNYFRIAATVSCRDCDYIPRIPEAGLVVDGSPGYQVMFNGVKIIKGSYHGDWMTYVISCLNGHHEPQEEKAFFEVLREIKPGATMIEAGSYWAYYSCWFQHGVEDGKSYLIEPNSHKLDLGKKNFELNNFTGKFVQGFISNKSSSDSEFIDWDNSRHTLDMISMDDFADKEDIKFIDLLHADIQGAELKMLDGCKKLIKEKRLGYIFLSTHDNNHLPCIDFLKHNDFRIIAEHSIYESVSGDGLIVACATNYGSLQSVGISHYNPARSILGKIKLLLKIFSNKKYRELFYLSSIVSAE